MSASTRTVQQPQGLGQMVAPFIAVGLAVLLTAALLLSRPAATTTQIAPAPGAVPAFNDHGSRGEFKVSVPTVGGGANSLRLLPE
jgi:hypothetical protein